MVDSGVLDAIHGSFIPGQLDSSPFLSSLGHVSLGDGFEVLFRTRSLASAVLTQGESGQGLCAANQTTVLDLLQRFRVNMAWDVPATTDTC